MKKFFHSILDNFLIKINKKDLTEDYLEEHKDIKEKLAPLLETAYLLKEQSEKITPSTHKAKFKEDFLLQVAEKKNIATNQGFSNIFYSLFWKRKFAAAVTALSLLLFAGGGTVYASQNSLPGSPLYPVKIAAEQVQYILTFGKENKARLKLHFAEKRTEEFRRMFHMDDDQMINHSLREMLKFTEEAGELIGDTNQEQNYNSLLEEQKNMLENAYQNAPDDSKGPISNAIEQNNQNTEQESNVNSGSTQNQNTETNQNQINKPDDSGQMNQNQNQSGSGSTDSGQKQKGH